MLISHMCLIKWFNWSSSWRLLQETLKISPMKTHSKLPYISFWGIVNSSIHFSREKKFFFWPRVTNELTKLLFTIYFMPKVEKRSFLTRKQWKLQQNLMMQIMQPPTTTVCCAQLERWRKKKLLWKSPKMKLFLNTFCNQIWFRKRNQNGELVLEACFSFRFSENYTPCFGAFRVFYGFAVSVIIQHCTWSKRPVTVLSWSSASERHRPIQGSCP